jgi:SRSO17 transposase
LASWSRSRHQRWEIEETFQAAKSQVGLDEHQVRQWTCWQRFTVLVTPTVYTIAHRLRWSPWRRWHQARARRSHYKRRLAAELAM